MEDKQDTLVNIYEEGLKDNLLNIIIKYYTARAIYGRKAVFIVREQKTYT